MASEIIKGIIALIIIGGAVYGLFVPTLNEVAAKTLLTLAGIVIGYYYGIKDVPFGKAFKKGK